MRTILRKMASLLLMFVLMLVVVPGALAAGNAVNVVANPTLGNILTDSDGRTLTMAQQYITAVRDLGDERVIMLDGEPLGAIARVPREDEHRSNLHVGGTARKVVLGERELRICRQVAERLRQDGLWLVGLDIIGDYLTEVNVTSPTGIQEIDRLDVTNLEAKVIDVVERKVAELKR